MPEGHIVQPRFTVVLPTYNRRDTILRAVGSVCAQTFGDWELVVVDDGSVDGTTGLLLRGADPRVRVLSQPNGGVAVARNAGLRAARGALVAFLDSDDEWTPHHLALADAFFRAHPDEHVYTSEIWQDWGPGRSHNLTRTTMLAAPGPRRGRGMPQGDPYLRFHEARGAIGGWGRAVVDATPHADARHYRAAPFDGWRWGCIVFLQATVITRRAAQTVGPFDERYRIASDYGFMCRLTHTFPVNFFSLPGCLKHETAAGGRGLAEDHLVYGGRTALAFRREVLEQYEAAHCGDDASGDACPLRDHYRLLAARAALLADRADLARELTLGVPLRAGADAWALRAALALPHARAARQFCSAWDRVRWLPHRLALRIGNLRGA